MNFDIDYRHIHVVRSPQAVPLLILVREWGRYKEAAFQLADVILLILRGIQPMANMEHGLVSAFIVLTTVYPNCSAPHHHTTQNTVEKTL